MSYLIFARKFRPQVFDEVVGQEPITTTLQNAIEQKRIPQSFLFSGPRGVGKTSTARIVAKALNCEKGPTVKPCGKCVSCKEIQDGNSLDVLEIDGASNRGIDEIRNLRETVKFKPSHGQFKIYIIDEVHMLTQEAFNALLKTLEEPPPHVKFIFATTEAHRVPLTILSRCQRFNFKRITNQEMVKKLEAIAKSEKIKYEPEALFLIAKASDGALRDGESLLDQLATFCDDKIKEKDVVAMLGLASEEIYFATLTAIKTGNVAAIFKQVESLYENGADLIQFAKGLLEMFRHLLLFQCMEKADPFVDWSETSMEEFKKRKDDFSRGELLLSLEILQNLQNQLRRNLAAPRLLVETTLLKLLHLEGLRDIEALAGDIERPSSRNAGVTYEKRETPPVYAEKKTINARPAIASEPPSAVQKTGGTAQVTEVSAPAAAPEGLLTINEAEAAWPRVIEYVKSKRMSMGIFLSEAEPVEIENHEIILGLPAEFQFHKETLEKDPNRRLVEEAFHVVSGKKVRVQFVITKPEEETQAAPAAEWQKEEAAKLPDIIMDAMNIFDGAKIIRKDA